MAPKAGDRAASRSPTSWTASEGVTLPVQRVIGVYRHEEYAPDDDVLQGVAELVVLKNKGRTGTAYVQFLPEYPAFRPLHWDSHPRLRKRLRRGQ